MQEEIYEVNAVKAWLCDYRDNDVEIDIQYERFRRFESLVESVGSPKLSDMPRSQGYNTDKLPNMIVRKIELEEVLDESVREHTLERERIEYVLGKLSKVFEKSVIRLRYIDGLGWVDVNECLFGQNDDFYERESSYLRRTHKLHTSAILSMAMYIKNSGDPKIKFFDDYLEIYKARENKFDYLKEYKEERK